VRKEMPMTMPRSWLYVPADKPDLFMKARAGIADAVLFDLEDAVPAQRKFRAREDLQRFLREDGGSRPEQELWVRITAESAAEDLAAVVMPGVVGVMQAKASEVVLRSTAAHLDRLESERLIQLPLAIVALIEDAHALEHLASLAAVDRVATFAVGEVDLLADLRMTPSPAHCRSGGGGGSARACRSDLDSSQRPGHLRDDERGTSRPWLPLENCYPPVAARDNPRSIHTERSRRGVRRRHRGAIRRRVQRCGRR
jgi:citrate lyase beta subunit